MSLNSTIADLLVEKGRAQAAGVAGAGNAWGQGLANIGQTIGAIPQQIAQQKADAQTRALRAAQLAATQAPLQDQAAIDAASLTPSGPTQSGVPMAPPTRQQILDRVPGHLRATVQSQFDSADESAAKAKKAQLDAEAATQDYVTTIAEHVASHNFDPGAAQVAIAHARETFASNPSLLSQVNQFDQAIQANPTPDGVKAVMQPLIAAQDAKAGTEVVNGQLVNKRTGAPVGAPVPKQVTPLAPEEIALKNKQIAEIDAKLTGSIPLEPKDAAELKLQRDKLNEEVKHNRATEAAANPFGLTGGMPQAPAAGGAPTAAGAPAGATPAPTTGDEFLKTLPSGLAAQVKSYAEGRQQFPTGAALRAPYFQQMLQAVGQYDPSFDAVNYNARAATRKDFTAGKSASTINALNTVAQHLDRLSTSADALNNSWSPAYNSVANFLSKQSGDKTVTNFETDKKAVVDELTRAWRQAGGSEGDIKSWSQVLDAANSPTQLHGAIGEMGQLLEGKLSAMENQFKQGMGPRAGDMSVVTPAARTVLTKLESKANGGGTPSAGDNKLQANATHRVVQDGVTYDVTTDGSGKVVSSVKVP